MPGVVRLRRVHVQTAPVVRRARRVAGQGRGVRSPRRQRRLEGAEDRETSVRPSARRPRGPGARVGDVRFVRAEDGGRDETRAIVRRGRTSPATAARCIRLPPVPVRRRLFRVAGRPGRVDAARGLGTARGRVHRDVPVHVLRVRGVLRAVLRARRTRRAAALRPRAPAAWRGGRTRAARVRRDERRERRPRGRSDVLLLAADRQLRPMPPFQAARVRAALLSRLPTGVLRRRGRVPPARRHGRTLDPPALRAGHRRRIRP